MSSRTVSVEKALELREALLKATTCTKCEWKGSGSQPNPKKGVKGCRHCMGPFFLRTRLTRHNLELLETYLADGDLEGLGNFRHAFVDRLPATQTTWQNGPLFVRSPGRIPILPTKEPVQQPAPKKGFKKTQKDC